MAEEKELKIELEQSNKDINKNVGSFSTNVVPAITDVSDGSESKKIPEQEIQKAEEKDPLINFDRFTKTKKKRAVKQATTQFGVKVEL